MNAKRRGPVGVVGAVHEGPLADDADVVGDFLDELGLSAAQVSSLLHWLPTPDLAYERR